MTAHLSWRRAGVGKTYEMLLEGHRRRNQGADVVIGSIEPHGRRATEKLVEGLEVMPRHQVPYRGTVLPGARMR